VIVFVHGVPETADIWNGVRECIGRESVAVALPGFGNPRPAGFGATKDDYVDWVLGELDEVDGPIDLVGHDWGAGFALRVATAHGDRLRSWAADVANIVHPDYVWHQIAQVWQTPGDGEAFVEGQNQMSVEDRAAGLEGFGVPKAGALEMAAASDADMGSCILDLYRSALPNPHHEWGPLAPTHAPGLVLHATDDPFGDETQQREVADALGAQLAPIAGAGHFWPYQAPDAGAAVLTAFWDGLD
jgi:pimeloyl-ACP methyl ester carboxylesterase